jgi:hypothetical protein
MRIATQEELERVFYHSDVWPGVSGQVEHIPIPDNAGGYHLTDDGRQIISLQSNGVFHVAALPESQPKIYYSMRRAIKWAIDNTDINMFYARTRKKDYNILRLNRALGFVLIGEHGDRLVFALERNKGDLCHLLRMRPER